MQRKIFIILFALLASFNVNAQKKHKYLLVQLFTDSTLSNADTTQHEIAVYTGHHKVKKGLPFKEQNLFCSKNANQLKSLVLHIDGKNVNVHLTSQATRNKFIVFKLYLNPQAYSNAVSSVVKNGDVIYVINECKVNCHKLEIIHPKILVGANGQPTTGYELFDKYIL